MKTSGNVSSTTSPVFRASVMGAVLVASLVTACDVGSVLGEGTDNGATPDASGGGGSGSGSDAGSGSATAQTMRLTFTTQTAGGVYSPAHVVAVWIEAAGGTFVKTIDRWSAARTGSLVAWSQKSGGDADAVSGATKNVYGDMAVTWDLKDKLNAIVPDGTYTIRMELADSNATAPGQNNQGTFTFTKGTAPETQSALTNGNFTNVSIVFTP